MAFFVSNETYTITVTDPEDGTEAKVELRYLNAGDQAEIHDTIALSEESAAEMKLGAMRKIMVQKAIVSWELPVSPTAQTIDSLHPAVFDQIFEKVNFGSSPLVQTADGS